MNELPKFSSGAYVVNLSPSSHKGTHWVAVYAQNNRLEYFDSYGFEPSTRLKRWWGKNISFVKNPYCLQGPFSSVCGQYCIYFILHRFSGLKMSEILSQFGTDVDFNDRQVYQYVSSRFNLERLPLIDSANVLLQIAVALQSWKP